MSQSSSWWEELSPLSQGQVVDYGQTATPGARSTATTTTFAETHSQDLPKFQKPAHLSQGSEVSGGRRRRRLGGRFIELSDSEGDGDGALPATPVNLPMDLSRAGDVEFPSMSNSSAPSMRGDESFGGANSLPSYALFDARSRSLGPLLTDAIERASSQSSSQQSLLDFFAKLTQADAPSATPAPPLPVVGNVPPAAPEAVVVPVEALATLAAEASKKRKAPPPHPSAFEEALGNPEAKFPEGLSSVPYFYWTLGPLIRRGRRRLAQGTEATSRDYEFVRDDPSAEPLLAYLQRLSDWVRQERDRLTGRPREEVVTTLLALFAWASGIGTRAADAHVRQAISRVPATGGARKIVTSRGFLHQVALAAVDANEPHTVPITADMDLPTELDKPNEPVLKFYQMLIVAGFNAAGLRGTGIGLARLVQLARDDPTGRAIAAAADSALDGPTRSKLPELARTLVQLDDLLRESFDLVRRRQPYVGIDFPAYANKPFERPLEARTDPATGFRLPRWEFTVIRSNKKTGSGGEAAATSATTPAAATQKRTRRAPQPQVAVAASPPLAVSVPDPDRLDALDPLALLGAYEAEARYRSALESPRGRSHPIVGARALSPEWLLLFAGGRMPGAGDSPLIERAAAWLGALPTSEPYDWLRAHIEHLARELYAQLARNGGGREPPTRAFGLKLFPTWLEQLRHYSGPRVWLRQADQSVVDVEDSAPLLPNAGAGAFCLFNLAVRPSDRSWALRCSANSLSTAFGSRALTATLDGSERYYPLRRGGRGDSILASPASTSPESSGPPTSGADASAAVKLRIKIDPSNDSVSFLFDNMRRPTEIDLLVLVRIVNADGTQKLPELYRVGSRNSEAVEPQSYAWNIERVPLEIPRRFALVNSVPVAPARGLLCLENGTAVAGRHVDAERISLRPQEFAPADLQRAFARKMPETGEPGHLLVDLFYRQGVADRAYLSARLQLYGNDGRPLSPDQCAPRLPRSLVALGSDGAVLSELRVFRRGDDWCAVRSMPTALPGGAYLLDRTRFVSGPLVAESEIQSM